ncbi:threonine-phosphate decarboxylase [Desulfosarcina alkanivorans]|uniref:Threonine-phosphate decarboxylase n=1 Tax=Desulfosarcina alkanivorans TaxID=571177 RepID=A0A5K7YW66_9BACT|nr:threonine-phosphate decarboxylase [Desulfosarcina alkanivorans]BBO72289.1 threonine-phosphate decarboxylase [Desulfosarcina alkanivorans]
MIGGHGGNIYQLARRLGCRPSDISDMSANVNPLGPMPALTDHLRKNMSAIAALPEVDAGGIVDAFARVHGIDPRQTLAGNGTTELIYRIPRALGAKKALVVGPTYSDYRDACTMNRVACDHLICREPDDFTPDMQAIGKAAAGADLVFFCNPNNPTGALVKRSDMDALCRPLPDTVFVIDESYLPFAPAPSAVTMIASDLPNVMVLNSMSKAFRIPGLRIGFVKAPPPIVQRLAAFALPWSVNSLAQTAVRWLMEHTGPVEQFLSSTRTMIESEKARIEECIRQKTGIRCFPSATSFMLMRLSEGLDAPTVWRHMADHRILIRDCANFTGLSDAFIRLSLKTEAENRRATDLLIRLCRDHARRGIAHEH